METTTYLTALINCPELRRKLQGMPSVGMRYTLLLCLKDDVLDRLGMEKMEISWRDRDLWTTLLGTPYLPNILSTNRGKQRTGR